MQEANARIMQHCFENTSSEASYRSQDQAHVSMGAHRDGAFEEQDRRKLAAALLNIGVVVDGALLKDGLQGRCRCGREASKQLGGCHDDMCVHLHVEHRREEKRGRSSE
jgi:hypothetical protein